MKAFHNDKKIKDKYLARVKTHAKEDEIVKGRYWENGKGCAVGCTIHSSKHKNYESELGIPEWLALVEDTIFEGLENSEAMKWPIEFLSAIKPGVDLDKIKTPFIIMVLESTLESLASCEYDENKFPEVKAAIETSRGAVIEMIRCRGEGLDLEAAELAARSAWSAAESIRSAAELAGWSAAESAAESAAWSSWSAAESAESAAESAAWLAAESADAAKWSAAKSTRSAAWAAWSAAKSARSARSAANKNYSSFATGLLKLIRGLK